MQIRRRSPNVQNFVRFLIFCFHNETAIRVDLLSPGLDTDLPARAHFRPTSKSVQLPNLLRLSGLR